MHSILARDGDLRRRVALLADAEARKDLAEQIVGGEFAGDRRERLLRIAQFLGEELERRRIARRRARAAASRCVAASRSASSVALAREERVLGRAARRRRCAHFASRAASTPVAGQRRQPHVRPRDDAPSTRVHRALRRDAGEVALVVDDEARQRRPAAARASASIRRARAHRRASRASTSSSARSARSIAAHVRAMPSRSTSSAVSRRPAVSTIVSGMPAISICRSTVSRVVPGIGVTIAASSRDQPIQQARLADVGRADQHDGQPVAQQRAGVARARARAQAVARIDASRSRTSPSRRKSMSSSGKSSVASVNIRSSISASTQRVHFARELAGEAARRGARGGGRRRFDQVGHAFRLREIELAVEERALREFAGLGEPRAELDAAREQQPQHRRAAVAVQLERRPRRCRNAARESRARGPCRAARRARRET